MTVLVRTFQSKLGREPQLIAALRTAATKMIQTRQADAVLLCQQCDTGERILWIETRQGAADGPALDESRDLLECASAVLPLEFLGGFYHFPMPACQVWSLEVRTPSNHQSQTVRLLLRLARRASADPNVVGLSLYRGIAPQQYFKAQVGAEPEAGTIERAVVWHPLLVTWSMGRLLSAGGSLLSPNRYPSTEFWAPALTAESGRQTGCVDGLARA